MESSLVSPPAAPDSGMLPATSPNDTPDTPESGSSRNALIAVVVWALLVLGLVAYLFFGSITARMWKLDSLQQAWVQD